MPAGFAGAWLFNLGVTLAAAAIVVVACGTGRRLLPFFRLGDTDRGERLAISAGLGLGALYLVVYLLGLAGLVGAPLLHLLLGAAAIPALLSLRDEWAGSATPRRTPCVDPRALPFLCAAGVTAAGAWLAALSPPIFYDALVYHLGLPNLYLRRGTIEALPSVYASFPPAGEMLYLLGMGVGGIQAASLLNLAAGMLAAAAAAALARRHWGSAAGVTAGSLFYLAPPLFLLSRYATGENLMTLHAVLAFLCLLRRLDRGGRGWLVLAGLFGGLAFSVKHVGLIQAVLLPTAALLAAAVATPAPGDPPRRSRVADALLFPGIALAPAIPWLAKNWLATGNPLFPAANALFGGRGWSPAQADRLARDAHAAADVIRSWRDALRLPLDLVTGARDFGAAAPTLWFWPLVVVAAAILLLGRPGRKERLLLGLLGGACLLWGTTFLMARFLLPAMALGAVVAAIVLMRATARRRVAIPWLLAGLLLATNAFFLGRDEPTRAAFPPALGLQSRSDYLRSMLRIWPAVEVVNRDLPASARILLLGESRTAWLERDHLASTALDRPLLPAILAGERDPGLFAAALRSRGITHVLVNVAELRRLEREYPLTALPPPVRDAFLKFLDADCRSLYSGNAVHLFELPPR